MVVKLDVSGVGMTSQRTRNRLTDRLREQGIVNEAVLQVMASTPRHLFVDEALAHRAYEDTALPIGYAQTNPGLVRGGGSAGAINDDFKFRTIKNNRASVRTPRNVLVVNADMDEELAYQLTQLLFENTDELIAVHPAANDTTVEFTMNSTPVPLHPGALRYFEEVGAEIPDRLRP